MRTLKSRSTFLIARRSLPVAYVSPLKASLSEYSPSDFETSSSSLLETVDFSMEAAYRQTSALLERRRDFTAIFAVADSMAIAAMKALADAGLRVPDDVSIIAIDGIEMSNYTVPTLTTLVQPTATLGERAVEILVDVLSGGEDGQHIRLDTTLRPGGTVGRA